jgi:integrase
MGGANPSYIARQLGHKNAGVTHSYYARWIDGSESRKEAAKVNRLLQRR